MTSDNNMQAVPQGAVLAECCRDLEAATTSAAGWVERNAELVRNEQDGLLKELRRAARLFRGCGRAATRRMCAGVFGPSQAGKSYLISALARGSSNSLGAKFGEEVRDFLGEINPVGGKESTGLVTRFTLERITTPADCPVALRMLSETDLVKIIANSWFADCEHQARPEAGLAERLTAIKSRSGPGNGMVGIDDMEVLREYLEKEFASRAGVRDLARGYWSEAIPLAQKLDLAGRISLYSLIWDENEDFTRLLRKLLTALDKLGHPEMLFCSMNALVPRSTSIIDVATLSALERDEGQDTIHVQSPAGVKSEISPPVLAALAAELVIVMADRPADFFEHTDLLDFPGYRSRLNITDVDRALKNEGMLSGMFLRGKVAYLFQRYCAERELNSMILCIGPGNQEVMDLPRVINDWVTSTHGEKPEDRVGALVSLLFVLTKFDMEFEEKKGATDLKMRWDIRLDASFLDFFGKEYDWPDRWTPDSGFRNMYLLRNHNFKFRTVLDYDGDVETGIKPESRQLVDGLHQAFLNSPKVAAHFRDPAKAWDEAMRLNDGGAGWIRANLAPVCDPRIKERQLLANIDACRQNLARRLGAFYRSDDSEQLRRQKILLVKNLFQHLGALEKNTRRMGELIRAFTISDSSILDMHATALRRFREFRASADARLQAAAPAAPADGEDADSIDLGSLNPFSTDNIAGEQQTPEAGETVDEAAFFAACIEGAWVEQLHRIADDAVMQKYFMLSGHDFSALATELATGAARLGLRGQLAEAFRKAASFSDANNSGIVARQAAIAARMINDYVDWLGYNPATRTDSERTVHLPGGASPVVFATPPPLAGLPKLDEKISPYTATWLYDWLNALAGMVMDNVNFDGEQTVNVAENAALGAILRKLAMNCGSQPA